jgi:hypothetical protein
MVAIVSPVAGFSTGIPFWGGPPVRITDSLTGPADIAVRVYLSAVCEC